MSTIRNIIKTILPLELKELYILKRKKSNFKKKTVKETFDLIAKDNFWSSEESVSGPGSELQHTKVLITELEKLFETHKVSSLLDLPCGDFNWMQNVDLSKLNYLGGDIVQDIIDKNKSQFEVENIKFDVMDIITSDLGRQDVVLSRDCLVHFSYSNIVKTIKNLKRSKSTYVLMTTFPGITKNKDIVSGEWRPLNFDIYPFYFPQPEVLINENYQGKEKYKSKSMALWKIRDLKIPFRLRVYCMLYKMFN
ncbi:class I SAM-dependent methyltransferase [uncultured Winogradskyella sp.]|uniref:class I SAM-dependent methyltransferase n=1 Tax=uncultured Winogradskyella sp. TaxID=395353 RepID=UPI00260DD694|nr:class I SAM-dependent methyltransferase [uncultured Winogradskyella sp.]